MNSFFSLLSTRIAARRGFSMVEMLVAVVIAGIVLTMAIPIYSSVDSYRADTECKDKMVTIARAEEMYRLRNRVYTADLTQLDFSVLVYDFNTPSPTPTPTPVGSGTPTPTPTPTATPAVVLKCPKDTATTASRALSYTVTLYSDTDGSPSFTIKDACGLHTAGKARQLVSDRNGLKSDSQGIKIDEVACP